MYCTLISLVSGKNRSTTIAIANVLASLIDKCKNNNKCTFVLIDFKKAFDFIYY